MKKFGEIVEEMFEEAKTSRGFSLRGFAKKAQVTATQLQRVFNVEESTDVRQRTKEKLAGAFGFSVEAFLAEVAKRRFKDGLSELPQVESWVASLRGENQLTAITRIAAVGGMKVMPADGQAAVEDRLVGGMQQVLVTVPKVKGSHG